MEADPDHSNSDSCAQRKKRQELWIEIERDLLKGQKLQGLGTCDELMACLQNARLLDKMTVIGGEKATPTFGLFQKIHAISRLGDSPRTIMEY
jgi:hypothetical protein